MRDDLGAALRQALDVGRDEPRLDRGDEDRAVARELVDLAPALLAFFVELVELGHDDREQLHHDRRRHVRHDAEREDRQLLQRAAREHVEHAEERAGAALGHDVVHLDAVDARDRDEHADAVDREDRQREQDPPAELRDLADICERARQRESLCGGRRRPWSRSTSTVPPAFSIFSFAVAETRVRLDRELLGELALAEDLDVLDELRARGPCARSASRSTVAPASNILLERRDVDRERLDAVRVLEAALRDPARHRHLTTLEREARAVVTRASLLALDALTGRLARARAATAAEPLLRPWWRLRSDGGCAA